MNRYSPTENVKYLPVNEIYQWMCPICGIVHWSEHYKVVRSFAESHWNKSTHGGWLVWE